MSDVQNALSYSSQEIDTGKLWINGKHIYKKSYSVNNPTDGIIDATLTSDYVDEVISNNASVAIYSGSTKNENSMLPIYSLSGSNLVTVWVQPLSNGLRFRNSANYNIGKLTATLEYTKTAE